MESNLERNSYGDTTEKILKIVKNADQNRIRLTKRDKNVSIRSIALEKILFGTQFTNNLSMQCSQSSAAYKAYVASSFLSKFSEH